MQREKTEKTEIIEKKKQDKTDMRKIRVLQRNLVYVIGLPKEFTQENILSSEKLFGMFGEITKVVLGKKKESRIDREEIYSAYITYEQNISAVTAIKKMDGSEIGGRMIKCTFGTTKYCTYFLQNMKCNNENCLYLHKKGSKEESFSRDQMFALKSKAKELSAPEEIETPLERLPELSELSELFLFKIPYRAQQTPYDSFYFKPFHCKPRKDLPDKSVKG